MVIWSGQNLVDFDHLHKPLKESSFCSEKFSDNFLEAFLGFRLKRSACLKNGSHHDQPFLPLKSYIMLSQRSWANQLNDSERSRDDRFFCWSFYPHCELPTCAEELVRQDHVLAQSSGCRQKLDFRASVLAGSFPFFWLLLIFLVDNTPKTQNSDVEILWPSFFFMVLAIFVRIPQS